MHLHLVRVAARPKEAPRPAKVVVLESRRKARLEARRPERQARLEAPPADPAAPGPRLGAPAAPPGRPAA